MTIDWKNICDYARPNQDAATHTHTFVLRWRPEVMEQCECCGRIARPGVERISALREKRKAKIGLRRAVEAAARNRWLHLHDPNL